MITKQATTDTGVDLVVDSLRLRLRYDYSQKLADLVELRVAVADPLTPDFRVSVADRNGRQDARGDFRRAFNRGQRVNLSAQQAYGEWEFERWLKNGDVISTNPTLTLTMHQDMHMQAVYRRRAP